MLGFALHRQAVGSMQADAGTSESVKRQDGAGFLQRVASGSEVAPSESASTLLMDAESTMAQLTSLRSDITKLMARVGAGGRKARMALARLIDLTSQPNAKIMMVSSGLLWNCKKLMSAAETPDDTKALAGSLITLMEDVPVTSTATDEKSGSYGHVNIVVPRPSRVYRADREILELEGGAAPSDTEEG
jgi:hypothetical protein